MLICEHAYTKNEKPKKIYCRKAGICVHVRYCAVSMKYYQTDNAKDCLMRYEDGKNDETGQNDQF